MLKGSLVDYVDFTQCPTFEAGIRLSHGTLGLRNSTLFPPTRLHKLNGPVTEFPEFYFEPTI